MSWAGWCLGEAMQGLRDHDKESGFVPRAK